MYLLLAVVVPVVLSGVTSVASTALTVDVAVTSVASTALTVDVAVTSVASTALTDDIVWAFTDAVSGTVDILAFIVDVSWTVDILAFTVDVLTYSSNSSIPTRRMKIIWLNIIIVRLLLTSAT